MDVRKEFEKALVCDPKWEAPHRQRYIATFNNLIRYVPFSVDFPLSFLDTGGQNCFGETLKKLNQRVTYTGAIDLRLPWEGFTTEQSLTPTFDVVLSLEVVEHIADPQHVRRDEFQSAGQICYLGEMLKHCVPGGALILTTPNSVGWCSLWKSMHGKPGRMYDQHVRELTRDEIVYLAQQGGWEVKDIFGMDVWSYLPGRDKAWRARIYPELTPTIREDDMFLYARKAQ